MFYTEFCGFCVLIFRRLHVGVVVLDFMSAIFIHFLIFEPLSHYKTYKYGRMHLCVCVCVCAYVFVYVSVCTHVRTNTHFKYRTSARTV